MYTLHLLPSVTIQPNLELKTRPNQLLGSLPLVIALPDHSQKNFYNIGPWICFAILHIEKSEPEQIEKKTKHTIEIPRI